MNTWNAGLYDNKHAFVSEFGKDLVNLLNPQSGEFILDVGCGTGDLAQQISLAGAVVIGADQSGEMVRQAKEKYPQLCFQVQDARQLEYQEQFHAVFSNAVLHWIKPPEMVLQGIWRALRPGGRFIAEFGGKGNVASLLHAVFAAVGELGLDAASLQVPWYFPSIGQYAQLMEHAGFQVQYAAHFARPTRLEGKDGLRNWMRMFGSSMLAGLSEIQQEEIIRKAEQHLAVTSFYQGGWMADYQRIRVVGVKAG